jgi:hypothetical protein
MPIYASDKQLYACFQSLFATIEANQPKAASALLKAGLSIRLVCSAPTASITINAKQSPVQLHYGNSASKPTVEVRLTSDTLHCLLLGEMRLSKAIGSNLVGLKGPAWKTLTLADLFHSAQHYYPDILKHHDLPATCPGAKRV